MIRVVLADDHGVVRKGLRMVLDEDPSIEIVGEACDGEQALEVALDVNPHVVILDVAMPKINGIQAAAHLHKRVPSMGILMLSMYLDEEYLLRAIAAGALGYLPKDSAEPYLIRAVHSVAEGKPFFIPVISETLLSDYV